MTNPGRSFAVWSDGSCLGNPGPGGYAAVVIDAASGEEHATVVGSSARTTNQRMEITAAARGLSRTPAGSIVTVHTDSKYVVDGMTGWVRGWVRRGWRKADGSPVANQEEWKALLEAAEARQVEWVHVRGHVGIEMNEKADRLANAAAREAKAGKARPEGHAT